MICKKMNFYFQVNLNFSKNMTLFEQIAEIAEKQSVYMSDETVNEIIKLLMPYSSLPHKKFIAKLYVLIETNNDGMMNRCTECGEDMGKGNPRQLCGKFYCRNS